MLLHLFFIFAKTKNMASLKHWVSALRPRTLFLAVASTICANGMAYTTGQFSISICILATSIATLLQLLSNLANDLGDYQHGTDTTGHRVGPTRTVQSGAITPHQMKVAISITICCSMLVGATLIYEASQFMNIAYMVLFLFLGAAAIWAAIKYTAGKNPYGYKGYGDIFSFFFFGPVAVVGTYFLHLHKMTFQPWLPAIGLGLFTAAVLNINNMRDMENDRNSDKMTLAIHLGLSKAKLYHAFLSIGGIVCFIAYGFIYNMLWYRYLYMILLIPFLIILRNIYKTEDNKLLDPYLKFTSLSAFVLSVGFAICINLHY